MTTTTDWTPAAAAAFFAHVEAQQKTYIARLAEAVAIDSVSCEVARRPKVRFAAADERTTRR
jgi:nonspecific dipeptidase